MALNISVVPRTIAFDVIILDVSFDRIERTTGLLHKLKFFIVYGKMVFLID